MLNEASIGTNIDYWKRCLDHPTPEYKELFNAEQKYLQAHIKAEDHVLDIGCGDGRNMSSIARNTKNIYGIDNDLEACKAAKERFQDSDTVKIIEASADNLPFDDNLFEVVTLLMTLPNLQDKKIDVLNEIARVLAPGGKLIVSTFADTAFETRMKIYQLVNLPIQKIEGTTVIFNNVVSEQFSLDQLKCLGESAGLTIVDVKEVGVLAYIVTYRKA